MKLDVFFISLTLLWIASIVLQCIPAGENVNDGLVWTAIISTTLIGIVPALNSLDNEMSKKLKGYGPIRILHIVVSLVSLFVQGLLYQRYNQDLILIAGLCMCASTTLSHFYFVYNRSKTIEFINGYNGYNGKDESRFLYYIVIWLFSVVIIVIGFQYHTGRLADTLIIIFGFLTVAGSATNFQPYSRIALMTGSPVVFFLSSIGWEIVDPMVHQYYRLVNIGIILYLGLRHSVLDNFYYKLMY